MNNNHELEHKVAIIVIAIYCKTIGVDILISKTDFVILMFLNIYKVHKLQLKTRKFTKLNHA